MLPSLRINGAINPTRTFIKLNISIVLLIVINVLIFQASHAQMRQLSLDATGNTNEVQEFSFYSPSEGYVAFTKYIGFTTDSGRTIIRKPITLSNVNFNNYPVNLTFGFGIKGVKAFSRDTIIVYGDYGLVPSILYSTNGGTSFVLVYHDRYDVFSLKTGITSMVFPQDHTTGYAVEADRILKTTNKGLNWFVVKLDVDRYYDHVVAIDNNNIFAFSTRYNSYKLFKTNNGGSTWTDVTLPAGKIGYANFLTAAKGWLVIKDADQNGIVYYTSNGGMSWEQKNHPQVTPFYSSKFHFVNDSTGYALAGSFNVYKTTDSGKVWEPLPRDNNYTYLGYSHNDIQVLSSNQLWAGGGHGFIEINTNSSDNPLPTAYFKADTNGLANTGIVNLQNYSKPNYEYKWLKNDTLISASYHTSFTHNIYQFRDTIKLIISDGTYSDTLVQYLDYPRVWITSFTPSSAIRGNVVTIDGYNFSTASTVSFGGVSASSFTIISNTRIHARVGNGAAGNVKVITAQMGTAEKGGFVYLDNPKGDLPSTISDSILCKSEPVVVTIQNSEPGVMYRLEPSFGFNTVSGSGAGTGGTISFVTSPISESGQYQIRAFRIGAPSIYTMFRNYFNIRVEHTQARFVADQVNITPSEPVAYAAQAGEAKDFYWTLYEDASTQSATGAKVSGVTYASSGQKTLQLISVSENGCRDTVQANATFVYVASGADANCIINPLDSTGATGMSMGVVLNGHDDNIYVFGNTNGAPKLRSMAGVAKGFGSGNHNFFAKYNANGVLKWAHYFKPNAGTFTGGQTDNQGNIYLIGYALTTQYLYFNNGDSLQFSVTPAEGTWFGERTSGFILKLDPNGKYIWHTILYDHVVVNQGRAADARSEKIAIKDDQIIVIGGFYTKLSYVRNGVILPLYDIPSGMKVHENHAVLKIGTDGALLWNGVLRFHATNWHSLSDVSIDRSGNCYLVGTYEDYLGIFNANGVEKVTLVGSSAYHRGFMVKYNATGGIEWHNNFVPNNQNGDATMTRVVADDDGNTYAAGEMTNWVNIIHSDGTTVVDSVIRFGLYKFDTRGKRRWGVGSRAANEGNTSALYISGNEVYQIGQLTIYSGKEQEPIAFVSADRTYKVHVINDAEGFVVKYDTAGIFKRIYTSGYNNGARSMSLSNIYRNSKGQFILSGNVNRYGSGSINKIFGATWPHPFMNGSDGFFVKLGADFCQSALTADAGPDKIGCTGDTVTIGTRTSGAYYSWTSIPAGFTSNLPNPIPKPLVNTTYYLKVTNDGGETVYDTVVVTLKPAPIADAGRDTTICANKVVFLSTPEIPGYTYQWYLLPIGISPGRTVGTTAQVRLYPTENSTYRLKVVGANGCPAYDTVVVSMLYNGTARVALKGPPAVTVCKGDPLTFTATIYNMGANPIYQWKLRGKKVGSNSNIYTTDSLKNGDWIGVDVIHNNICESQATVGTTTGSYTVLEVLNPAVTLTGNNVINEGNVAVINAAISNAGTSYQLKWQDSTHTHDWQDLPIPSTATTYNYKPAVTGDKIRLTLTTSSACAVTPVSIATMNFTVNKVTGVEPVPAAQYGLRYYPNPVQKRLSIDGLRLADRWQQLRITGIDGQQNLLQMDIKNSNRVEIVTEGLRPGMYVAILRNSSGVEVYLKFIKL